MASVSNDIVQVLGRQLLQPKEEEGEQLSFFLQSTSVVVMLTFLILFTGIFEVMKEAILEASEGVLEPITHALFSELTVLGFLGLVTFALQKARVFNLIGDALVKHQDHGEELAEIFETVHMTLFLVMVIYLMQVFLLIHVGNASLKKWNSGKDGFRDQDQLMSELRQLEQAPKLNLWARRRMEELRYLREYIAMKSQFVHPASSDVVSVPRNFHLADYLCRRLGHTIAHAVELPLYTWLLLELAMLAFYGVQQLLYATQSNNYLCLTWMCFSYMVALGVRALYLRLAWIRSQLIPQLLDPHAASAPLLQGDDAHLELAGYVFAPPPYLKRRVYRSWLGDVPSVHQQLFGLGTRGPGLYLQMIRLTLLFMGIHVAMLVVTFGADMYAHNSLGMVLVYLAVYLWPCVLIYAVYLPDILRMYTVCVSVEMMKNPADIRATQLAQRGEETAGIVRMMLQIQQSTQQGEGAGETGASGGAGDAGASASVLSDYESRVFDQFDKDHSGSIDTHELVAMMEALGKPVESPENLMAELDENSDGHVSKQEFAQWLHAQDLSHTDHLQLAKYFFRVADKTPGVDLASVERDELGNPVSITVDTFRTILLKMDPKLSEMDAEHFIDLMDPKNTRKVEVDAFAGFLKAHNPQAQ